MKSKVLLRSLAVVAVLFVAGFAFLSWCYAGAIASVETNEKVVALTYDDGPNPPHTEALLAVLAELDVVATFFLKGQNVDAFPDHVGQIAAAGHEIGNHSYHHAPMYGFARAPMLAELERVNAQLESLLGYTPHLFRPPYGVQGPGLKRALDELQMVSVLANATGLDWELTEADEIAAAVLADVVPGGIVLLHDGHGDTDEPQGQNSRAATVAATQMIISELRESGYRFVTVSELLALEQR